MPIALMILGLMNSVKQMQEGDKMGGMLSGIANIYNSSGMFASKPYYDNSLSDSGVRRNVL